MTYVLILMMTTGLNREPMKVASFNSLETCQAAAEDAKQTIGKEIKEVTAFCIKAHGAFAR